MMKIAENKIRPATVTMGLADAFSFQFAELNVRALCEPCDEAEIELLAIIKPPCVFVI